MKNGKLQLLEPNNIEIEKALLGAILIDGDLIHTIDLKPADFFIERHGWIFEASQNLVKRGQTVDYLSVSNELQRHGRLEDIGGDAELTILANACPSSLHGEDYAREVKHYAIRRALLKTANKLARLGHESPEADSEALISQAYGNFNESIMALNVVKPVMHIKEVLDKTLDDIQRPLADKNIIPTGLTDLDRALGGFKTGQFITVGGRSSMGKSSLANKFAISAAKLDKRVLYVSLETKATDIMTRMLAMESGIPVSVLMGGREAIDDYTMGNWAKIVQASDNITHLKDNLAFYDREGKSGSHTPDTIKTIYLSEVARCQSKFDLLIIDYITLFDTTKVKGETEALRVGNIARQLHDLALELDVAIVALSQLNREVEKRGDKRPTMADFLQSSEIENSSDVCLLLYRDDYYNREDSEFPNVLEVIIGKAKHAPAGKTVRVYYHKETTNILDLTTININDTY